jgi:XRE family aerobic/anaerobic benzoate catabolism transcriptional regulator
MCEFLFRHWRNAGGMANEVCVRLGQRVRELRTQRGWRQIDLAAHSGVHKTIISDLERGERDSCLKTLDALADALGTTARSMSCKFFS